MIDCSNVSNQTAEDKFNLSADCRLFDFSIYTIFGGCLCVLGLAGNVTSFSVLWRDRSKTATAFLLRSLAVADSLVLVCYIPLYGTSFIYPYTGSMKYAYDMYVMLIRYLWGAYFISYTGTIMLTVLVSLNRYIAVCRPYSSANLCSIKQARRQVAYVALFSVIYNIPRFFEYEHFEVCVAKDVSQKAFEFSAFGNNFYYRIIYANVFYFLVMHGGPLLSLAFLNYKLILALKKRAQRRSEMGKKDYQQDMTLVLVVVIFVFMSCQTPTFIDHILWTALEDSSHKCGEWHYYYTAIGDTLAILNSSVNFLIYVLTSRKFRQILLTPCRDRSRDFLRIQSEHPGATGMTQVNNNNG